MSNPALIWGQDGHLYWQRTPTPNPSKTPHRIKVRFLLSEYKGTDLKGAILRYGGRLESNSNGVLWASFEMPPRKRPSEFRACVHENVDFYAHDR